MILGLVVGFFLFVIDSFIYGLGFPAVYTGLLAGFIFYKKKAQALAIVLCWSALTDVLYYPRFPLTTLSVLFTFLLWGTFIEGRFSPFSTVYLWLSTVFGFLIYIVLHLLFNLLALYILDAEIIFRYDIFSYLGMTMLTNILILGIGIIFFRKFNWSSFSKNASK